MPTRENPKKLMCYDEAVLSHWHLRATMQLFHLRIFVAAMLCTASLCHATAVSSDTAAPDVASQMQQASATTELKYNPAGSGSWVPYYFEQGPDAGLVVDLVNAIFAHTNIKLTTVESPAMRTLQALHAGKIDFEIASPSWFDSAQDDQQFVFSDPFLAITERLVYVGEELSLWQQLSEVYGRQVGTVRGYYYHDAALFERVDFPSERELVVALSKGRINVAIIGDAPAAYWAKQLGVTIHFGAIHSAGQLAIRIRKDKAKLLPAINSGIAQVLASEQYQQTLQRYNYQ